MKNSNETQEIKFLPFWDNKINIEIIIEKNKKLVFTIDLQRQDKSYYLILTPPESKQVFQMDEDYNKDPDENWTLKLNSDESGTTGILSKAKIQPFNNSY